ncbi:MAG: LysE family translocator [Thermomicrobiales bacterium]|nr:LysE family translocator [Thermomicrobiales bacterium]MCO5222053.1 LysE family translocator [Thermomicrobiales bacterium]
MSVDFLIVSLIVALSPGTGVIVTLAAGISRGARAALVAAVGCTLGIVPHMLAAITGLAALLHSSALLFESIKYAGVAYLLFMAYTTLRSDGPLQIEDDTVPRSDWQVIRSAVLVNVLNPKLSIFFLAFLPQFVSSGQSHQTIHMIRLSVAFMAITFVVFAIYGLSAAIVRDAVLSRPAVLSWIRRGFALSFVGLGVKLVLTKR